MQCSYHLHSRILATTSKFKMAVEIGVFRLIPEALYFCSTITATTSKFCWELQIDVSIIYWFPRWFGEPRIFSPHVAKWVILETQHSINMKYRRRNRCFNTLTMDIVCLLGVLALYYLNGTSLLGVLVFFPDKGVLIFFPEFRRGGPRIFSKVKMMIRCPPPHISIEGPLDSIFSRLMFSRVRNACNEAIIFILQ